MRRLYPLMHCAEVACIMGRGAETVRVRASKLKIAADQALHRKNNWRRQTGPYELCLTDTETAYLAGVFDGEGWVARTQNPRMHYRLGIANTYKPLIDWISSRTPKSKVYFRKSPNPKWKDDWRWVLDGNLRVLVFLQKVLPHLTVKKEKSEEVIKNISDEISRYKAEIEAARRQLVET